MLVGASRQILETLKVQPTKAADFELFWQTTLSTMLDLNAVPLLNEHSTPMKNVIVKQPSYIMSAINKMQMELPPSINLSRLQQQALEVG